MDESKHSALGPMDVDELTYVANLRTCLSWSDATARGILLFMGAPTEFVNEFMSEPLQWIEEAREANADLEALRDSLNPETLKEIVTRDDKTRERFFRAFEYRALQSIAHSAGSSKAAYELLASGTVFRASICVLKAQEFLNIASAELIHRDGSFLAGKLRDFDPKESGSNGAFKRWGDNLAHKKFVLDQWARE